MTIPTIHRGLQPPEQGPREGGEGGLEQGGSRVHRQRGREGGGARGANTACLVMFVALEQI